jgi:hypothetical protein
MNVHRRPNRSGGGGSRVRSRRTASTFRPFVLAIFSSTTASMPFDTSAKVMRAARGSNWNPRRPVPAP